jgi:hypothetical protein
MEEKEMLIKIYNQQDRLGVAQILIKNGYTVSQTKRARVPGGKTVDYFLKVKLDEENANTTK